ncbi:uncharacterized protein LOC103848447 isoform X1 [Brassica rapa]|uniref:uncharacterized protein LOC103848447 isoform X1 n=1 Tax=Brassica campestris TaxID=3711 RepID=UPI00142E6479|nr:uncharacterized protein LOC103848447 isoform X1 [Brassica rapa]
MYYLKRRCLIKRKKRRCLVYTCHKTRLSQKGGVIFSRSLAIPWFSIQTSTALRFLVIPRLTPDLSFSSSTNPRFYRETSTTPPRSRETSTTPPLSPDLPPTMKQSAFLSVDSSSPSLSSTVLLSLSVDLLDGDKLVPLSWWPSARKPNRKLHGSRTLRKVRHSTGLHLVEPYSFEEHGSHQ